MSSRFTGKAWLYFLVVMLVGGLAAEYVRAQVGVLNCSTYPVPGYYNTVGALDAGLCEEETVDGVTNCVSQVVNGNLSCVGGTGSSWVAGACWGPALPTSACSTITIPVVRVTKSQKCGYDPITNECGCQITERRTTGLTGVQSQSSDATPCANG